MSNQVFISYSRADEDVVRMLQAELKAQSCESWVDWEGIQLGDAWWTRIEKAIEESDAFAMMVTKTSIASEACLAELAHAVRRGKRLIPLVRDPAFNMSKMPDALKPIQWVCVVPGDDFEKDVGRLIAAIKTDFNYVKRHTEVLNLALAWERAERPVDRLARGAAAKELADWAMIHGDANPLINDLQRAFIDASVDHERARQKRRQSSIRNLAVGFSLASVVVIGIAFWAFSESARLRGLNQTIETRQEQADQLIDFLLSDYRDQLVEAGRFDLIREILAQAETYYEESAGGLDADSQARLDRLMTEMRETVVNAPAEPTAQQP